MINSASTSSQALPGHPEKMLAVKMGRLSVDTKILLMFLNDVQILKETAHLFFQPNFQITISTAVYSQTSHIFPCYSTPGTLTGSVPILCPFPGVTEPGHEVSFDIRVPCWWKTCITGYKTYNHIRVLAPALVKVPSKRGCLSSILSWER